MTMGLTLDALQITQAGRPLVRLSAHVPPGQVLTVMGPSGSGKSTLLSAVIGALPAGFTLSGRILLNGDEITTQPTAQRRIGLLFQDDVLFPHLSVAQNLGFGLRQGGTKAERSERVEAALERMGLAGFGPRDPASLSGGQRARVALARTLLAEPLALLLDEPFSRLDQTLRAQIRDLVFHETRNLPVILVTHDPEDARAAAGPVVSPI
ncbi:ATP-binding cassette domain-containing protein [Tabrizicola sp.]|uniref:ATP-binding cassette domain-containing protein n=1 Tax=Tabrizicola sp. TaxID=2005166 RepID=UPI003D26575C